MLFNKNKEFFKKSLKKFSKGFIKSAGRNNTGRITVRHRGGGLKRVYRFIDFWRRFDLKGVVVHIMKDPFRSANIAIIVHTNGLVSFILAAEGLQIGDFVWSGQELLSEVNNRPYKAGFAQEGGLNAFLKAWPKGSSLQIGLCPVGLQIFNIELRPGFGAQLCRSAGTYAIIVKKLPHLDRVILKLKSGLSLSLSSNCIATIGMASNMENRNKILSKAGTSRRRGRRPAVRGVAMNPVDHPHGGGEGKTSGGHKPKTPWGLGTKGVKTISKRKRLLQAKRFQKLSV